MSFSALNNSTFYPINQLTQLSTQLNNKSFLGTYLVVKNEKLETKNVFGYLFSLINDIVTGQKATCPFTIRRKVFSLMENVKVTLENLKQVQESIKTIVKKLNIVPSETGPGSEAISDETIVEISILANKILSKNFERVVTENQPKLPVLAFEASVIDPPAEITSLDAESDDRLVKIESNETVTTEVINHPATDLEQKARQIARYALPVILIGGAITAAVYTFYQSDDFQIIDSNVSKWAFRWADINMGFGPGTLVTTFPMLNVDPSGRIRLYRVLHVY